LKLCEKYNWSRESQRIKRARRERLERLHPSSREEVDWRLETDLSSVPLLAERETLLSRELLHHVVSYLEIRGISTLETV